LDELRKPHDPLNETTISLLVVSTATKPSTSNKAVLFPQVSKISYRYAENLRKILHYSSACGLRKGAIGVAKCTVEFERHGAFGVGIAISSSRILFVESEGGKVLRSDSGRCKAEQAANPNHEKRERLHVGDWKKNQEKASV
jgi:hypothetical protein